MEKRNNVKYYIRQAKSFDVVIFDMKIPKNAIYGREQNTYYYIDNFEQFKNVKDRYEIFIFTLKDDYFRKVLMIKNNTIMRKVIKYVKDNNLYDVKCINPFGIKLDKLYKMECGGNNRINSYKSVSKQYYSQGWFKR